MKVYIAGPINGYENLNREAFLKAASRLVELGHEPINPHDVPPLEHAGSPCLGAPTSNSAHAYGCYMIPDLKALLNCEGYTLLDGWQHSQGATVEEAVAKICGLILVEL